MHCRRFASTPVTRRQMLMRSASGFGAVALAALLNDRAFAGDSEIEAAGNPLAPRPSHFPAKAKSVIFLYMDGGAVAGRLRSIPSRGWIASTASRSR